MARQGVDTVTTRVRSCSTRPPARSRAAGLGAPREVSPAAACNIQSNARRPVTKRPHPLTPREDSILYELHVRGFTVDPSSGVRHPGTFAGLIEKIPYLRELGVTAVELLPIDEFDENDCPFVNPLTGERLRNFWGYNTIAYAAPKAAYSSNPERSAPWHEFRSLVNAFHDAGIEVVLDVVFNHTAEGGEHGPTYNFRGLDNSPCITCSTTTAVTSTSPAAGTPSTPTIRSSVRCSSPACATSWPRPALTGSGSTSPRSWAATNGATS